MDLSDRHDALAVWKAAVAAVDSGKLVRDSLRVADHTLHVCDQQIPLKDVRHIEVVGAGKAGAGMARAAEQVLAALTPSISISGRINVPDDCVEELDHICLVGARPGGLNEPTQAGMKSTREMLRRVSQLQPTDLCLVLLSGGGSALLPTPSPGITLDDKLIVTRLLSSRGASIQELNAVRSRISAVKSGGLARACRASQLVTLVISDVIGDPLEFIASGPTWTAGSPSDNALTILRRYDPELRDTPESVIRCLEQPVTAPDDVSSTVAHHIIGNNKKALTAGARDAENRGYQVIESGSDHSKLAADLGRKLFTCLADIRRQANSGGTPVCLLCGGETTVQLCDEAIRGKGGRNQEIVLSAVTAAPEPTTWHGITLLSGGTDGEDGPTSAAGAFADSQLVADMHGAGLDPADYLERNDAWSFFDQLGGLINTGPTHTNVMDVQVGIVSPD